MASKMDSQNLDIWQALAELARETEQLDRAERAYRTLLLMVRRGEPGKQIGASEVFIELSDIAEAQGESDKANELVESALEALSKNDVEAPRLQAKLLQGQKFSVLQRVLEARLEYLENRRQRAQALTTSTREFLDGDRSPLDVVAPGEEIGFLAPLPVRALHGVGPRTADQLASLGIETCAQLSNGFAILVTGTWWTRSPSS